MNWRISMADVRRFFFEGARLQAYRQGQVDEVALAAEGYAPSGPKGPFIFGSGSARLKPRPFKAGTGLRRSTQIALLVLVILMFLGAGDDTARFNSLGHRIMCTCGCGQVLLECNHVGCQSSDKMRNELLAALERGDNDDLILQGFVQNYGPTVIAAPTAKGFNRIAWIMPFVALALGMAFVLMVVRAWKNKPAPALADGITIPQGDELDELRAQARKETDL
jgi:cytochrome c-type biogenesis protein CcmH/NrfF